MLRHSVRASSNWSSGIASRNVGCSCGAPSSGGARPRTTSGSPSSSARKSAST